MIDNFLNTNGSTLLDRCAAEDQQWFWLAIGVVRERFPRCDIWTTGGVDKQYIDIRIGKKTSAHRGSPVLYLRPPPGKPIHLTMHKDLPRDQLDNDGISRQSHPTENDIRRWIDTLESSQSKKLSDLIGSGRNPSSYSASDQEQDDETEPMQSAAAPLPQLNQILFGPPGTGKTYATIDCALEILDPALLQANPGADAATRQRLKGRFDQLVAEKRIRFVTFHQSFSYEDFVEGLRASSEDGQLHYRVEPGIFRQICADAVAVAGVPTLDELLQQFIEQVAEAPMTLETARGKRFSVSHKYGNTTLTCIPEASESARELPVNIEHVRQWLHGVRPANIYCESYVRGVVEYVQQKLAAGGSEAAATTSVQAPFVLIIDEINRGNVSRIFGELITLIEPSKRTGADEALTVSLPYSREPFSVPGNLFIIGTMNTADRSLAGLDIALRRRFNFREMPPRPDLLNGLTVAGINIGELLTVMNQRIEVLLDRDHCLGHAYFMPLRADPTLDKLALIFSNQVLPLLQEYFFEDWQRIQWVLNDHRKPAADCFVKQAKPDVARLFGNVSVPAQGQGWWIDQQAFGRVTAYHGVIGVVDTLPDTQDATEGEDA